MKKIIIVLLTILLMWATRHSNSETINDINLDITVQGQGSTVVVFEAGFGMSKDTWEPIAGEVSRFATTVTYSRAGIGQSQSHAEDATINMHVNDLHDIIKNVAKGKPVVLVGHSYGGMLSTVFAQRYPVLVKGLVLIDPAVLAQRQQLKMLDAQRVARDDQWLRTVMPPQLVSQYNVLVAQMDKADARVHPIDNSIPVVLFTATSAAPDPMVLEETAAGKVLWLSLHNALMRNVVKGAHFLVGDSGHFIYREHPEMVIQAISDVVLDVY
jgi:pimeloyl-ACP methyl ester carboxylesterase